MKNSHFLPSRWRTQPETPRCPSRSSSASSASSPKPDPPLPAGALIQSWLPAARVWWTCPSGAGGTETETAGRPKQTERRGRGERPHLRARSLETSKSQTLEGTARGNRWVWAIPPGEGGRVSASGTLQQSFTDSEVSLEQEVSSLRQLLPPRSRRPTAVYL